MRGDLIRLKLVLDAIGISPQISTFEERITIQKSIFLVQRAGIFLGFDYNWYIKGPYSAALTKKYYKLNEALENGEEDWKNYELRNEVVSELRRVKNVIEDRKDIDQPEWLELLASTLYFYNMSKNIDGVRSEIENNKNHLSRYFDEGVSALRTNGFIPGSS